MINVLLVVLDHILGRLTPMPEGQKGWNHTRSAGCLKGPRGNHVHNIIEPQYQKVSIQISIAHSSISRSSTSFIFFQHRTVTECVSLNCSLAAILQAVPYWPWWRMHWDCEGRRCNFPKSESKSVRLQSIVWVYSLLVTAYSSTCTTQDWEM